MEKSQKIVRFTDLIAWKEGHKLVLMIYKKTDVFPKEEKYGLTDQMRRAVVSVTSNIAEGFTRKSNKEKIQFYKMSQSSLTELQNQLIISRDIKYLDNASFHEAAEQSITVNKLINGLLKATRENKLGN